MPWPDPPRLLPPHGRRPVNHPPRSGAAPSDIVAEERDTPFTVSWAELDEARVEFAARVVPPSSLESALEAMPAPAAAPSLSPGLSQLLNAALIDPAFCAAFLEAPRAAARRATTQPAETFGTTLPDRALQLPPPTLADADLALLAGLPRAATLAAAARELLRRNGSHTHTHTHAAVSAAPMSREGALVGAA